MGLHAESGCRRRELDRVGVALGHLVGHGDLAQDVSGSTTAWTRRGTCTIRTSR